MKKLLLLCTGTAYTCLLVAQPLFQTSLEAGFSLPVNSNGINQTHTGKAIQFGNHLDYLAGNSAIKVGLGAYIGYINALSADGAYKENAEAIAEKYRFAPASLVFNSSDFKSTQVLVGPVASFGAGKLGMHLWAKAGYGLNEPSRYSVLYKENGASNNIYVNQGGEHKNGFAYAAGAGLHYSLSGYVALRLDAHYFGTQTDQVNYNFDREKGLTPLYYTAANQFIQLSAGLQFTIGNPNRTGATEHENHLAVADTASPAVARMDQKIKTKSNIRNDRVISTSGNDPGITRMDQKIKTKSNIKNDRMMNAGNDDPGDSDNNSLVFSPEKIDIRTKGADRGTSRVQLQAVDNYLTGFVYRTASGNVVSQCGSNAMPGDPIPGIDVRLRSANAATDLTARTNRDGSFSFNNIAPGNYTADAGGSAMDVTVKGNAANEYTILDVYGGSCGNSKENYVLAAGDKTYVEVISARETGSGMASGKKHVGNVKYEDISAIAPRESGSGMATGRRMHKPYRVADTEFEVNMDNIVSSDGKLYAEVITAREGSSGMASGRRTIVTGDLDGDGIGDYAGIATRDAASGMATGKRMHKPFVVTKEINLVEEESDLVAPRDAASGMATGKRMHKPFVVTKEINLVEEENELVAPRDAASGMATGKRMHKPFVVRLEDNEDAEEMVAPRDAASGMASGKRQYQPLLVRINPDENSYQVIAPRDAASGMATGKRMHKPFVITKEIGYTENGEESVSYRAVIKTGDAYQPWDADTQEDVVSNPLYHGSGNAGVNPLHQSDKRLSVTGGNGKDYDVFIPSDIQLKQIPATGIAAYSSFELMPAVAPEQQAKSISEKGVKKTEAAERKGWDGTVKGGSKISNEASSGNVHIKEISRVHCANGSCAIDAIVEAGGASYEALITGTMKTRHETVKNSIGNIR